MKKYLVIVLMILVPSYTFAASRTSTPSATPVNKEVQNKIDDLKERLATKVAELRKTSPRAIFGTITQVSVSMFTVDSMQKAYKIELTDDIAVTQQIKGKRTTLATSDLEKNDVVTIFGEYDETLDVLQAKRVFIEAKLPIRLHGIIDTINKKDNSFTIKGIDGSTYTIDVESTTKNNLWTRGKGIEKGGFSKLERGMYVTVVGSEKANTTDTYTALRIVALLVNTSTPTVQPTASPSATIKPTIRPQRSTPTPTE